MAAQTRANGTGKRWSLLLGVVSLFLLTALGTAAPALADDPSGHTAAPWIASDQPDYAPGSNVVLTGGAWEVGETVRINVNDDRGASWERAVDVTADANGNITDSFRLPDWFIASYTVKATGSSGAVATASFTDGNVGVTSSPVQNGANEVTFALTYTVHNSATSGGSNINCSVTATDDAAATETVGSTTSGPGKNNFSEGVGAKSSIRLAAAASASQPSGWTFKEWTGSSDSFFVIDPANPRVICVTGDFTGSRGFQAVYEPAVAATTLTVAPATGTYGGTTNLSATLASGSSGVGGKSISFSLNGSSVGSATTTAAGVATLNDVSLAGIDAGTYANGVSASFAGDSGFTASSGSASLTVGKAATTTTVTCSAGPFTYNGAAHTPCSANVTGAAGLSQALTVAYSNNTDAGTASASASFAGTANYLASSDTETFSIDKAATATTVTCDAGPFTYDGSAHTPCSAGVTGPAGLNQPMTVSYTDNVNAGTATASASYGGSANYHESSSSRTFEIEKASSVTTITCPVSRVYTGAAIEPCSASVTGAGGLDESVSVSYTDNVNAGTASASATYAGDANHNGSGDTDTFEIEKASSVTTITCPVSRVYTGAAIEPCSASATGAGGLDESVSVSYTDNVNAGTASASATYAGDANHNGSGDTDTFEIEKAPSVTTVTCSAGPFVYSGSPHTPCTAKVTGAGGLDEPVPVTYTDNVNAGTASAAASYPGDANHNGSGDSKNFTISKATPTVTVNWTAWTFDGTPHPASGSVTGVGGANLGTPTFTYYSGSSTAGTPLAGAPSNVGTYTVLASYAGSANYNAASATKTVQVVFRWDGFLQPINDTAHQTGLAESRFRLGQTIPAKFVLKDASGAVVQQSPNPTFSHSNRLGSCDVFVADETITEVVTPNAGNTFAWSGTQYHYNWSTKGLQAGEYRIYANLADGTRRYVDICLTK